MIKLTAELVPKTSWYFNVRSNVSRSEWDKIRRFVYKKAGNICEICGGIGNNHPVECHEIWEYNEKTHVQRLAGMIALCPNCHSVKHLGRAKIVGIYEKAFKHLMRVNKWDKHTTEQYVKDIFTQWENRSKYQWKLDLNELKNYK